jgi:hypothetical protein
MGKVNPTFSSFRFTVSCSQLHSGRGRNHLGLLAAAGKGGRRKGGEERCHANGRGGAQRKLGR